MSPISRIGPYSELLVYKEKMPDIFPALTGIPILDNVYKSKGGQFNYNHLVYVTISKLYLKDSLIALFENPIGFLKKIVISFFIFFRPASDYDFLESNRFRMGAWPDLYEKYVMGQFQSGLSPERNMKQWTSEWFMRKSSEIAFINIILFFLVMIYGFRHMLKSARLNSSELVHNIIVSYLFLYLFYVTSVSIFSEYGENNRYHMLIEPYQVILLGLFIQSRFNLTKRNKT